MHESFSHHFFYLTIQLGTILLNCPQHTDVAGDKKITVTQEFTGHGNVAGHNKINTYSCSFVSCEFTGHGNFANLLGIIRLTHGAIDNGGFE